VDDKFVIEGILFEDYKRNLVLDIGIYKVNERSSGWLLTTHTSRGDV